MSYSSHGHSRPGLLDHLFIYEIQLFRFFTITGYVLDFSNTNLLSQRNQASGSTLMFPPPPTASSFSSFHMGNAPSRNGSTENSTLKAALQLAGPLGYKP